MVALIMIEDLETYWSAELGEPVEILTNHWANIPVEFSAYISGRHVVSCSSLEKVEDWMARYSMVREQV